MEEGFVSSIIVSVLDPEPIYEGMSYIAGIAAFFPWLFVVAIAVRLFLESQNALSFKSAMASAISDTSRTLLIFLLYTGGGMLVFVLMFAFSTVFSEFGSVSAIHGEMLDLRSSLMISAEDTKAWYETAFEALTDTTALPITAIIWLLFQLLSLGYVFISQLIEILFAIAVVGLYAWGFLVIATMTLGDKMNLSKSWIRSALTLFIWVIIEPIFLGVVWLMGAAASEIIAHTYSGYGYGANALTVWYLFSVLVMFVVLLVRLVTPFIAMYLARNDTYIGALAGAAAATSALVMNQILESVAGENSKVREQVGAFANSMTPNAEGARHRDSLARVGQRVSDFMNTPVSDLTSRVSGGLGGLGGGPSGAPGPDSGIDAPRGGGSTGGTNATDSDVGPRETEASGSRSGGEGYQADGGLPGMPESGNATPGVGVESPAETGVDDGIRPPPGGEERLNDLSASYDEYSNLQSQDVPSDSSGGDGKDGKS